MSHPNQTAKDGFMSRGRDSIVSPPFAPSSGHILDSRHLEESFGPSRSTETAATTGQNSTDAVKPKVDIKTLEQFIEYAYSRKGQRVILKSKVEKSIAQNPRLEDDAMSRLLALAAGDTLLAVPRQLLLVSWDIEGYPALRTSLASFVSRIMLRHSAFADTGVQGALLNLPEAPPAANALAKVAAFSPADEDGKETLKGTELQALRRNAAQLFATWLASNRRMNAEALTALLFQVMWAQGPHFVHW